MGDSAATQDPLCSEGRCAGAVHTERGVGCHMEDPELNPYPSSKLGPPRYGRPPVARPRLLSRLETQTPLLLMVAPAGSGKTALLTSWVAARPDLPCIWYRLDPA